MSLVADLKNVDEYTATEKKIAEYILNNSNEVKNLTIDKLAELTFSSSSAIIRLCKKLKVQGFSELKIKIATETNNFNLESADIGTILPFCKGASAEKISRSFLNLHYQSLTNTFNDLDFEQLQQVADYIDNCQRVCLYGTDQSLIVAEGFHFNLLRIGYDSSLETMSGFQTTSTRRTQSQQVAIIISEQAKSRHIQMLFYELQCSAVPIILIHGNEESPWVEKATIAVLANSEKTRYKMGSFVSRTSMQLILDIIFGIIFEKNYNRNIKTINDVLRRGTEQNFF